MNGGGVTEKSKKWMKTRHKVILEIVRPVFGLIARLKYHVKPEKFKDDGRNMLILSNHQTDFDQFIVGLSFKSTVYYVAMEDLFSLGLVSRLIEWLVAPIPIMKASTDIKAIKTCIRVAREGGNIALFPEGNRTYSGKTCYIKPGVASLAKNLGLPIAIYRIEGGFGVKPRFADNCRRGPMTAGVRRVIEPEEYKNLSKEELHSLICKELYVDESSGGEYYSDKNAENLERVIYICKDCGISEFKTEKDILTCKKCGKQHRYLPNKQFSGVNGECDFKNVAEWYEYQENFIRNYEFSKSGNAIYNDTARFLEIRVFSHKKTLCKSADISLFSDRIEIKMQNDTLSLPYDDIRAMACVAGHKLNIFSDGKVYQLKGNKSFNALKYCNLYYHAKYIKEEHTNGEFQFLGL